HRRAGACEIEIEVAGAAEVRIAGQCGNDRIERERRGSAGEPQARLLRRVDFEAAGELSAVEASAGGVERRTSVTDRNARRDIAKLEPGESQIADADVAVDPQVGERLGRQLDVAG